MAGTSQPVACTGPRHYPFDHVAEREGGDERRVRGAEGPTDPLYWAPLTAVLASEKWVITSVMYSSQRCVWSHRLYRPVICRRGEG